MASSKIQILQQTPNHKSRHSLDTASTFFFRNSKNNDFQFWGDGRQPYWVSRCHDDITHGSLGCPGVLDQGVGRQILSQDYQCPNPHQDARHVGGIQICICPFRNIEKTGTETKIIISTHMHSAEFALTNSHRIHNWIPSEVALVWTPYKGSRCGSNSAFETIFALCGNKEQLWQWDPVYTLGMHVNNLNENHRAFPAKQVTHTLQANCDNPCSFQTHHFLPKNDFKSRGVSYMRITFHQIFNSTVSWFCVWKTEVHLVRWCVLYTGNYGRSSPQISVVSVTPW